MVKPDATQHLGAILSAIHQSGLVVINLRMARLSPAEAAEFYAVHRDRPFFPKLQGRPLPALPCAASCQSAWPRCADLHCSALGLEHARIIDDAIALETCIVTPLEDQWQQ